MSVFRAGLAGYLTCNFRTYLKWKPSAPYVFRWLKPRHPGFSTVKYLRRVMGGLYKLIAVGWVALNMLLMNFVGPPSKCSSYPYIIQNFCGLLGSDISGMPIAAGYHPFPRARGSWALPTPFGLIRALLAGSRPAQGLMGSPFFGIATDVVHSGLACSLNQNHDPMVALPSRE